MAVHSDVVGLPRGYPELDRVVHSVIGIEAVDLAITGVVDQNTEVAAGFIGGDMLKGDRHRVRRRRDLVVVIRIIFPILRGFMDINFVTLACELSILIP